jgi:hypothetical protein
LASQALRVRRPQETCASRTAVRARELLGAVFPGLRSGTSLQPGLSPGGPAAFPDPPAPCGLWRGKAEWCGGGLTRLLKDNSWVGRSGVRRPAFALLRRGKAEVSVFQELIVSEMECEESLARLVKDIYSGGRLFAPIFFPRVRLRLRLQRDKAGRGILSGGLRRRKRADIFWNFAAARPAGKLWEALRMLAMLPATNERWCHWGNSLALRLPIAFLRKGTCHSAEAGAYFAGFALSLSL